MSTQATNTDETKPEQAGSPAVTGSARLEWEYQPDRVVKRWRGYLRGYPDTTLVVLHLCEDRDDRCHMLGAVMPDSSEPEHTRCLVTWAKAASEMYLQDFVERLTTQPQSDLAQAPDGPQ